MTIDWGFSLSVVLTGLVVVFVVLILLVLTCDLMGVIFRNIDNKKKLKTESTENEAKTEPKANVINQVSPVGNGVGDDVVVAISAAIAAIMSSEGENKPFAIKSIKRARGQRPAWNAAGISDNTRQF